MKLALKTLAAQLAPGKRQPRLLVLAFHQLLPEMQPVHELPFLPFQPFTVDMLEQTILKLKAKGYNFPKPEELGKLGQGDHVLITFDDGYANNLLAVPLLEKHQVPAVFFINTANCLNQKRYWWDVIWQATMVLGWKMRFIYKHVHHLKALPVREIEEALLEQYDDEILQPTDELDRPMSPIELTQLGNHELAYLGLHGHTHDRLTLLSKDDCIEQLAGNWQQLEDINACPFPLLAYPNGDYNQLVLEQVREVAHWAFTTKTGINPVHSLNQNKLILKRVMPNGLYNLDAQLAYYHAIKR